ncbi:N-acetyltransferase [Campylobacter sp. MIT 99-7217]|uniref:GNAT family N-acetyltransferase n=1 Tax=Campylobacter sp. MIT 99-7217 TaxID=535091 RepID=UPI0011574B84|nr:GNAT family N-acetyltransferase [Campylobacter sp. MIT 99-7217]TQR34735.1 N-acetyltransferase [Campylobacter sp. MIT 99-7217]
MKRLKKNKELKTAFTLMRELRSNLEFDEFLLKFKKASKRADYKLFAFKKADELIALCGVMPFYVLYHTNCLYICDFVVKESLRGQGYGEKCLKKLCSYAKEKGFEEIELSSSFFRTKAHDFYEKKMKFEKTGFVFKTQI